jgi:hypothetical protein
MFGPIPMFILPCWGGPIPNPPIVWKFVLGGNMFFNPIPKGEKPMGLFASFSSCSASFSSRCDVFVSNSVIL